MGATAERICFGGADPGQDIARKTRTKTMAKLATLLWIVLGITFAGVLGLVILATPALAPEAAETLPWAALVGFILAIPASVVVARKILEVSGNR
jgi:hypothetical protein